MSHTTDEEIELLILSSCINDPYVLGECVNRLRPENFYFEDCRIIFHAIRSLALQNIELDTVKIAQELESMKRLGDVGGRSKIVSIAILCGSGLDSDYYIKKILEKSLSRSIAHKARLAADKCISGENPEIILENLIKDFSSLQTGDSEYFTHIEDVYKDFRNGHDYIKYLKHQNALARSGIDPFDGYRTGYKNLDELIGGFEKGTNNIIGARSSSGKTTFFVNLFINFFRRYQDKSVGFFSLEMPNSRIYEKIISTFSGVSYKKMSEFNLTPEEIDRISEASTMIAKWNLYLFDKSGVRISEMKAHIRKAIVNHGLDIIFIDYLTRIQSNQKYGNKHLEIDEVSKGLQDIALEFNIPVVTLSQLNRNIYGRTDKTPVLADLRESGSIEEDADIVLLMHRPAHYDPQKIDDTEIIVAKSRNRGELGKVTYKFESGRLIERDSLESIMPCNTINAREEKSERRY